MSMDQILIRCNYNSNIRYLLKKDYERGLTEAEKRELEGVTHLLYRVTYYSTDNTSHGFIKGIEARCKEEAEIIAINALKEEYSNDFIVRGCEEYVNF